LKESPFKQEKDKLIYLKTLKLTKYGKTAKDNRTPGFKQYEEQLNYLETVESTKYGKTANGNRMPGFVHQSQVLPVSDLST
jgi:hypothetical protein